MSQQDIDIRAAEVKALEEEMEACFPSLIAHGLHITSQEMSLFNQQYDFLVASLDDLCTEDKALAIRLLRWFHHNYRAGHYHHFPRRLKPRGAGIGTGSQLIRPRPVYRPTRPRPQRLPHLPVPMALNPFRTLILRARMQRLALRRLNRWSHASLAQRYGWR